MIKLSIIVILAGLLLPGCKEKKSGVEIVPNLETIYNSPELVYFETKESKKFNEKINEDIIDAIQSLYNDNLKDTTSLSHNSENTKSSIVFKIALRLYINENGKIDKVKDIYKGSKELSKGETEYNNREKLDRALAGKMSDWNFEPGIINGQKVKYWNDFKVNVIMKPDGTHKIELPDFLNDMPDVGGYSSVDKMPKIIMSSQPRYPQLAKLAGIEGRVYVKLYIDTAGTPLKAVIIKSDNEIFNQVSLNAAMQYKFSPAIKNNKPISIWIVLPFKYTLDSSKEGKIPSKRMEKR